MSVNRHVNSATIPKGEIVDQTPVSGTSAKAGLVIYVTISDGPVMVTMPAHLVGEDCSTATSQLAALKVTAQCPAIQAIVSTIPSGRVARVLYRGSVNPTTVPKGSTVTLQLSKGATGTTTTTTTTTVPVTTTTKPGTTTTSTSTTTTTTPAATEAMPNVAGMTRAQVFAAMKAASLYFSTRGPGANSTKWTTAVSSVPVAGTRVKKLSTVIINVK